MLQSRDPFCDHRTPGSNGPWSVQIVRGAQILCGSAGFHHGFRPGLDPLVEALILAHLGVELQREEVLAPTECLVAIEMAGGEQFNAIGQGEGIAVPMQHGHSHEMMERVGPYICPNRYRVEAHFLDGTCVNACSHCGGHHLRAKTDPKRWKIGIQPLLKPTQLAGAQGY